MGDCNINMLEHDKDTVKHFNNSMNALGLNHCITEVTRDTGKSKSCIDLILSNDINIKSSGTHVINLSDHDLVYVVHKKIYVVREQKDFIGRSYRKYDKDTFQEGVTGSDWSVFDESDCVEEKWQIMKDIFEKELNKICPVKTITLKAIRDPWVDDEMFRLIMEKNKALVKH